ncbi:MAG: THUMP domain-containing protein, partial [Candidatus Korarchaeota archaeon]|nr:THUMP domain-containing protein [Candidatus Korarchaeota archaeon]
MGLGNEERGRALKTLVLMELHRRIREGDEAAREELRALAPRLGRVAAALYEEMFSEPLVAEECWLCSNRLGTFIEEAAAEAARLVEEYEAESFLVGCRVPRDQAGREEELKLRHGLIYAESIRSEVRREVGKRISAATGLEPCFEEPDITLIVDLGEERVVPVI